MLMDEYFSAMKNVLTKAENTQRETILVAADEIANRLEKGGAWHIMDTGHMLMFEAVGRTGGMMAIKPSRSPAKSRTRCGIALLRRAVSSDMTAFPDLRIMCWAEPMFCRKMSL